MTASNSASMRPRVPSTICSIRPCTSASNSRSCRWASSAVTRLGCAPTSSTTIQLSHTSTAGQYQPCQPCSPWFSRASLVASTATCVRRSRSSLVSRRET
ncbi:Uncharacterised protein [Mycobacteroides abscessus subsp. abscessus]|nr:Uncharacterised protein [Mycobacteroides abscessus subsp. abscessus]